MYVNGMGPNGPLGPEGTQGPRPVERLEGDGPAAREPAAARDRADRVEISVQGRAMAAAEQAGLGPEQLARLKGRVDSGFYNRADVMTETARRIVVSGDL